MVAVTFESFLNKNVSLAGPMTLVHQSKYINGPHLLLENIQKQSANNISIWQDLIANLPSVTQEEFIFARIKLDVGV